MNGSIKVMIARSKNKSNKNNLIKSPLRYPGGKSRAIKQISEQLPQTFLDYREPFVGGGSVFIYLKQIYPNLTIWINDLNPEVYLFWKIAQSELKELVTALRKIKSTCTDGRQLFEELTSVNVQDLSDLERAVRFFVLNRITFSGTIESGGFSQQSFLTRFTDSSIDRLESLQTILKDIKITNLDYSEVIQTQGKDVFIFLDPPYFTATKSKLYGKDGDLHTSFDHQRFAKTIRNCQHQWLITYDNSPEIRKNFQDFTIIDWELQYGMNNYQQGKAEKGKEIFIRNYHLSPNLSSNAGQYQQLSLKF
ncbi:D12 class N6 adenine-specific DNA methyltransferase [Rippkaea orientalis PCC 8801]|uniref:site-specific DNA-methyltransferase (adenine-specific) n=1 Tax=Rippkaea orientalis (strain PCC 8801 / RF-1) TaxID=41431 RepID=B7JYV0_RIPO1|nr:DNA adenine methylase [Rippkaea orientalis]ACK66027.1 D12 class N6 adenine-specific DNA methyltransferase [Rippkaea orientalis PCC 8801]